MITVIPRGGLANRMRVMISAQKLSEITGHSVKVKWVKNRDLGCHFKDLFDLPEGSSGFSVHETIVEPWIYRHYPSESRKTPRPMAWILRYFQRNYINYHIYYKQCHDFFTPKNIAELKTNHNLHIVLDTSELVTIPDVHRVDYDYSFLKPKLNLKSKISSVKELFNEFTIGVHIRRGDFPKRNRSDLAFYMKYMDELIVKDDRVNFYLCSDESVVKRNLLDKYGNKIITNINSVGRTSTKGVQEALVDLYSLSSTKKIIGTYNSSFSITAAKWLSDIPLILIRSENGKDKSTTW